jgi:trigger factor
MNVTATPTDKSTVVLDVELPAASVQRAIDEAVRHLGRRTRVPGFRPGKVPRPMLERALGVRRTDPAAPDPVYDDAKEHLYESSVVEAITERDLDILSIPQPEWIRFVEGEGAAYRVVLPIRPEVKLGAYTDYPFGIDIDEIDDEKVERVVEQLREQNASLVPVEGRGAQEGDYAVIGFVGRRDGVPFEGGTAERYPLRLGSDRMIPGFEQALEGMVEDEERTFPLTFPPDYGEASLAGQDVEFTVTLRDLRVPDLPDVDDGFAQSIGSFRDLSHLKDDIARRLAASARDHARHAFSERVIEFAVANATVTIPELLVEREVEVMHDELRVRLAEQGIEEAAYLLAVEKTIDQLHTEWREPAEHRVKVLLVLSAVADAEGVEASDAAVQAEIDRARARSAENPKLISYFESPRGRAYLKATLRRTEVVELLVDRWLEAHPEVGPLPHLHDSQEAVAASAAVGDEHDHAHHGHDHHPPSGAAAAELDTRSETQEGIPA